jgi:hypothetical protein
MRTNDEDEGRGCEVEYEKKVREKEEALSN